MPLHLHKFPPARSYPAEISGSIHTMPTFRHTVSGPGPEGDFWNVTLHSNGSATIAAAHTAWTDAVTAFITGSLGPLWSTQTQATESKTDQLDPVTGKNTAQATSSFDLKGTGVGAQLPQRVAVVCGLRTSLPTRAGRGRMYWPAPGTDALTSVGQLSTADAQTIATGLGSALATMSSTVTPVIFHRLTKTFDTILQVTVGNVLGTQRRRTNKVLNSYASAPA